MSIPADVTHTDEFGNFYRVIGDKPQEFCVDYLDKRSGKWTQDLGKNFDHLVPLNKAYSVIQCQAPCGTTGDFLYSHKTDAGYVPISPIFTNYTELALWAKANGWRWVGGLLGWYEK